MSSGTLPAVATMYPPRLLPGDCKSRGEEKVFDALASGLPDPWEAYHSASWIVRDPAKGAQDGEIDFVLVHPERAIVCLEVLCELEDLDGETKQQQLYVGISRAKSHCVIVAPPAAT